MFQPDTNDYHSTRECAPCPDVEKGYSPTLETEILQEGPPPELDPVAFEPESLDMRDINESED